MRPLDLKAEERHMLPRWLPSQLSLGEFTSDTNLPHTGINAPNTIQVEKALTNLSSNQLGTLEDTLAYGYATGCISSNKLAQLAKRIQLERKGNHRIPNSLAEALADTEGKVGAIHLIHNEAFDRSISWLRRRIRYQANDSLAWLDLGYLNALRGNLRDAERNVMTAMRLGPSNPFVIRSGGRFLVHTCQVDTALKITRRALDSEPAPDLVASEIALSDLAKKPSRWLTTAKKSIFSEKRQDNSCMAEIAAAVATTEAKHGSRHKLRRILSRDWGLIHENIHSQLLWITHFSDLAIPTNLEIRGNRAETNFREAFSERNYSKAVEAACDWLDYQPFSTAPATYGSFVAATHLQDYKRGIKLCESGLFSNPLDFCLLNNASFCAAKSDDLENANFYLKSASNEVTDDTERAVVMATHGLVAFRSGDLASGDRYYRESIEYFDQTELPRESWLATAMWAEERCRAGDANIQKLVENINRLVESDSTNELPVVFRLLKSKLREGIGEPPCGHVAQPLLFPSLPPTPPSL